ncbi:hypothetical protein GF323_03945 [Candidatus Woesearchaeota archaeon]|nr:hypothetical protein [Candidatus Woesearchaeota archaeon]
MAYKIRRGLCWVILIALASLSIAIEPSAPDSFENISADSPVPSVGTMFNTSGGTITTLNFNATTQNPRWKAFVGNISGEFALQNTEGMAIYDWSLTSVQGEIYATRNSTLVDWDSVSCATNSDIGKEQDALGFSTNDEDNINRTFYRQEHDEFYAGDKFIAADSCPSTNLYVNGTNQSQHYQELLLNYNNLIYTGLLENAERGFSNQSYDYQLIVPDNTNQSMPSESYYFYIELI